MVRRKICASHGRPSPRSVMPTSTLAHQRPPMARIDAQYKNPKVTSAARFESVHPIGVGSLKYIDRVLIPIDIAPRQVQKKAIPQTSQNANTKKNELSKVRHESQPCPLNRYLRSFTNKTRNSDGKRTPIKGIPNTNSNSIRTASDESYRELNKISASRSTG